MWANFSAMRLVQWQLPSKNSNFVRPNFCLSTVYRDFDKIFIYYRKRCKKGTYS